MGKPSPLMSSFKLSYYTLLNLMRRLEGSGQDIEFVIKRSFQQFQFESNLPQVQSTQKLDQNFQSHTKQIISEKHLDSQRGTKLDTMVP